MFTIFGKSYGFVPSSGGGGGGSISRLAGTTVINSTSTLADGQTATASHTATSGTDRLLIAIITGITSSTPIAGIQDVTFGGNALTEIETIDDNRSCVSVWYLKDADIPTGSQTFSFTVSTGAGDLNSHIVHILELEGVNQTTSVGTPATDTGTDATCELAVTTTAANSWIVGAASWRGDTTAVTVSEAGATLELSVNSGGTSAFSDNTVGVAYEEIASAGAETLTLVGNAAQGHSGVIVEILAA